MRTLRHRGHGGAHGAAGVTASACLLLMFPAAGSAQDARAAGPAGLVAMTDPTINPVLEAAEADGDVPRRRFISWNEYEGPYFTARLGGGFLYDFAGYDQDEDSEKQMPLQLKADLRDFRFLLKGQLKFLPGVSYTMGYMYEKSKQSWRFRQTGISVEVPRLYGSIFIGRTKEGFSTSKMMVGYQGWTNERAAINDAFLPILADGIKWSGYVPSGKFVYRLGWYNDTRSEDESFNKNDRQFTIRGVWLPYTGTDKGILHLALQGRFAASNDGFLQYRARPESFQAQTYAIDTGKFPADNSKMLGLEVYYRPGPLMFGMEYFFNQVSSTEAHDPFFHGGEIFAAYLLTGETRPYNLRGSYFEKVSPARTVFEGGPGAWELVLRYSYADLDGGTIRGGKFQRITPMVNWHLNDNARLELVTGYGILDRFETVQGTFFLQGRLQLQL